MKSESIIVDKVDEKGNTYQVVECVGGKLMSFDDYAEQQMGLLKMFGLKGLWSFENYEVIVRDDNTKVLRKREYPLKCDPSDESNRVVSQMVKTKSEHIFGRDGKEEDSLELTNPQHNLEVGEVEGWERND